MYLNLEWKSYKCRIESYLRRLHCQSCSKSGAGLLPCCHQAHIRMRSHRLPRLDDNKSAARCQQASRKLIVKTFYPQASCKSFQQLAPLLSGGDRGVNVSRLPYLLSVLPPVPFCELSPASCLFSTNLAMLLLLSRPI